MTVPAGRPRIVLQQYVLFPITSPEATGPRLGSMMMSVLTTPSAEGMPMAIPSCRPLLPAGPRR
jgi:hypothetical protein